MAKKDEERMKKRIARKRKKIILTVVSAVVIIGLVIGLTWFIKYKNAPRAVVKEYKGLQLSKFDSTVTEEDYDVFFKSMLSNTPNYEEDKSKSTQAVKEKDVVNIDFVGKHKGEAFSGGSGTDVMLEIGSNKMIEGFEESIVGKKPGDSYDVTIKFPANYVYIAELSGEEVVFSIKVNYIGKKIDTIDDAYIARNTTYKTIKEYKDGYLTKYLSNSKESYAKKYLENQAIDLLIKNSKFYNLDKEVDDYYDRLMDNYKKQANSMNMSLESYVLASYDGSMADFKAMIRNNCEIATKQNYILDEVAKKEKLKVTDDIYKKYIDQVVEENNSGNEENLKANYSKDKIDHMIMMLYALDVVYSYAEITEE